MEGTASGGGVEKIGKTAVSIFRIQIDGQNSQRQLGKPGIQRGEKGVHHAVAVVALILFQPAHRFPGFHGLLRRMAEKLRGLPVSRRLVPEHLFGLGDILLCNIPGHGGDLGQKVGSAVDVHRIGHFIRDTHPNQPPVMPSCPEGIPPAGRERPAAMPGERVRPHRCRRRNSLSAR